MPALAGLKGTQKLEDEQARRARPAPAPAAPEMTAVEREAALELLRSPRLMERILEVTCPPPFTQTRV